MHNSGTISPTTLDWIQKLVSFDTTSRESNLALIETIREELVSHALSPLIVSNAEGTKANLFVTIPAVDGTSAGASCSPGTPMLFRSMGKSGPAIRSAVKFETAKSTGAEPAT